MQITIRILPIGEEYKKTWQFQSEMRRGFRLLEATLESQIMNATDYAVGSGAILDRKGQPLIAYEIKP